MGLAQLKAGTGASHFWAQALAGCVMFLSRCVSCAVCEFHHPLSADYVLPLLLLLAAKPESTQTYFGKWVVLRVNFLQADVQP